jgi:DNA-binding transcriptional ArsR family regulator
MLSAKEYENLQSYIGGVDVTKVSAAFDALGEPNRCLIFRALLKSRDVNVGPLAKIVGISESLASQHLKVLLQAGLVSKRREGKQVYYQVNHQDGLVKALQKAVEV